LLAHLIELKEADLLALKEGGQAERKTLDYKRDVVGGGDKEKREFLYDVSSFANTDGGYLIFGMGEENGVPKDLVGLAVEPDKEILRLQQMLRSGIRPALAAVEIVPVELTAGRHAIVMHIPKSWNPPHQVVFQNAFRFCARDSRGKYFIEVDELRSIFAVSGTIAERVRNLRIERVAKIAAADTAILLQDGGCLVLHVVPFSAFTPGVSFPLDKVTGHPREFPPMGANASQNSMMTFDGYITSSTYDPPPKPQRAYTQISRTGVVEAATSSIAAGNPRAFLVLHNIEALIITYARRYMTQLNLFGVQPPIAVFASLLNVEGLNLIREYYNTPIWGDMPAEKLRHNQYHFVESIFEIIPTDYREVAKGLKGTLDHLANAAGLGSSPHFDAAGNYELDIPGA
jgi:hypothetical protein